MATHSSVLAGGSHGQRSVGGYSQWSCRVEHMKLVLIWLSATNLWVLDYILLDNGKSHMVYLWAVKATDITNDGASEERAARCCRSICLPNSACRRCSYKHFLSRPAITALSWWHHRIARVSLDEFTAHTHEPMLWTLRNTHCSGSSLQSKFHPARQHLHGTASCSQLHGGQPGVQSWSLISGYAEQHVPGDSGGAELQGHWSQHVIQMTCGHHTLAQWAGWTLVWWPCRLTPALFLLPSWVPWPLMPSRCLPASTQLGISFQRNQHVIYMASNSKNAE